MRISRTCYSGLITAFAVFSFSIDADAAPLIVAPGGSVTISTPVSIDGSSSNQGSVGIEEPHGELTNNGPLDNFGTLTNNARGTIFQTSGQPILGGPTIATATLRFGGLTNSAFGRLANNGTLTNVGDLNNEGGLFNNGVLNNGSGFPHDGRLINGIGGVLRNTGTLSNLTTLYNFGTLDNRGTLTNTSTLENFGTLDNRGTLAIGTLAANGWLTQNGLLTNNGTFIIEGGSTVFSENVVDLNGTLVPRGNPEAGAFRQDNGQTIVNGLLELSGVDVGADRGAGVNILGGTLGGSGTVIADLTVGRAGTVGPGNSPGLLQVFGDATFAAGSTLAVELGGLAFGTGYDRLDIADDLATSATEGTVSLADGTVFDIDWFGAFTAGDGDFFDVLVADEFAPFNLLALIFDFGDATLGTGLAWETTLVDFGGGREALRLSVTATQTGKIPAPGVIVIFALGLAGIGYARRRRAV